MILDHVGIVVPDIVAATDWYRDHFGLVPIRHEAPTDVDPHAIGLPDAPTVRLTGRQLDAGNVALELHQYFVPTGTSPRRNCDLGYGHIAFRVEDIHAAHDRLTRSGMPFNTDPRHITTGGLAGFWWAYGKDPWGNTVEITSHP